jgi:cytochrome oxidase Cu insertion factor (SCO1/SenC/PrrC family)
VDQHGQAFNSSSLDGKVWIASFFFTSCPSACWKLNQELSQVQNEAAGSDLRLVSITCDPDNDTSEALDRYAKHFKADPERWTFLTGEFREIRRIGNDCFKVAVEKGTHSDRAMIVDRSGKVRGRFRLTDPTQLLVMKNLLAKVQSEAVPNGSTPGELSSSPLHPAGKDRFAR